MGEHKPHYPVFLSLEGRLAIVVGGDAGAHRKVRQLVRCGADVVVVTPEPSQELRQLEADGLVTLERRSYMRGDLEGAFIAYSTVTGEIARAVFAEAETRGCLINVAHSPDLSSYLVPSSIRRGRLQIAISTGGAAPAAAKRIRTELKEQFGEEWGAYVELLGDIRLLVAESIDDAEKGARLIAASADADYLERLAAGQNIAAADAFEALLAADAEVADSEADEADTDAVDVPPAPTEPEPAASSEE